MKVVHLSDFHSEGTETEKFILGELIDDLKKQEENIDLIVFTGDLINKGGCIFNNINDAFNKFEETIITPLLDRLGIDKDRFIFVPGNHDIDRNADNPFLESGLKQNLNENNISSEMVKMNNTTEGIKRILPFKKFEEEFHVNNSNKIITKYHSYYKLDIKNSRVGIACFNSAWRCYNSKEDKNNLILGIDEIIKSREFLKDCDLKLALMHHEFDYLVDFELDIIKSYIEKYFDLLFYGHVHSGNNSNNSGVSGDIFISVAPQNSALNLWNTDSRHTNGYSIINYNLNEKKVNVKNRKYSSKQSEFVANTDLAPENGIKEYTLNNYQVQNNKNNTYNINEIDNVIKDESNNEKVLPFITKSYFNDSLIENIKIDDNNSLKFAKNNDILKTIILDIATKSKIFRLKEAEIETFIYVVDKLIVSNKLINVEEISEIVDNFIFLLREVYHNTQNKIISLEKLFNFINWWFKNLYKIINNQDNLPIINENEIYDWMVNQIDTLNQEDYISILLKSAKETSTIINSKNLERLSLKSDLSLVSEVVTCLILPIYSNIETFQKINATFYTKNYEFQDTDSVINYVKNESNWSNLLDKIRDKEINETLDNLFLSNYLIVEGDLNSGVTEFISCLIDRLEQKNKITIIFSFKYSNDLTKMVQTIIDQCNIYMMNKINIQDFNKIIREALHYNVEDLSTTEFKEQTKYFITKYNILKKFFIECIKRITREYGKITLIIDSIDKINQYNNVICDLFQEIHDICHVVLSAENESYFKSILENSNLVFYNLKLKPLTRNEIPIISGIEDNIEKNKKNNDKIYQKTKGSFVNIRKLINTSTENSNKLDLSLLDHIGKIDNPEFERDADICLDNVLLEEILLLLATFESITPISIDYIQRYLAQININYRLPKIRNELKNLTNQISDYRFNRIKLVNSEFASFLLNTYFSPKDVEDCVNSIFIWLSKDIQIKDDFTCEFFKGSIKSDLINKEIVKNNIIGFVENVNNDLILYKLGYDLFFEEEILDLSLKFLFKSSDLGNPDAMNLLGYIYYKGQNVIKDISKAQSYLNKASELGNIRAKLLLSNIFFSGQEIEKNVEIGQKYLEEAIALGSKAAKFDLAMRLLIGIDIDSDSIRGHELLLELVKEEYPEAVRIMGNRYLFGDGVDQYNKEGIGLLNKAIEMGNRRAKLDLARYLVTISESDQDISEGLRLFNELIKENYIDAKIQYSNILIHGFGINKDIEKGIYILKTLVDEGDQESILEYSKMLIEGNNIKQDKTLGFDLLNKLVDSEFIASQIYLGDLFIDGKYIEKDIPKGIDLLQSLANKGNTISKRKLALRYLYGFNIEKNIAKGEGLFKEAIIKGDIQSKFFYSKYIIETKEKNNKEISNAILLLNEVASLGFTPAKRFLGELLIEGTVVNRNITKGLLYLNDAISLGDPKAMRILGHRLVFGITIDKDLIRGEDLLRKSSQLGDDLACTILGHAILLGEIKKDIKEGIELLKQASKVESNAMRILGLVYLKGMHGLKDKNLGEKLLRVSVKEGDNISALQLSTMLLDGFILRKNIEEGKQLLLNLIDKKYEDAILEYTHRLLTGNIFDKQINKGIALLESISTNNLDAKLRLAYIYIYGKYGVERNISKGENLLRDLEKQGHVESRRFLSQYILQNIIVEKEEMEGIKLLEKSISVNDYLAMEILGDYYLEGLYVEQDINKATELYEKSIQGNNNSCKVRYALKLIEGEILNKDVEKGIRLLKEASENGYYKGKFELSRLLIDGKLIPKDVNPGLELLDELVSDNYKQAKKYLAGRYIYGQGIPKNVQKCINLYEELVKEEYTPAIIEYAELLIDGYYIQKDVGKGEKLLKYASQKGSDTATYILAKRYLGGDGLKKHITNGKEKLMKAVNHSSEKAQLEYGIRLKRGIKVKKDTNKAITYIKQALKDATTEDLYDFGVTAYHLKDYELATELLTKSYRKGNIEAGTSLAYMRRRNEIRGSYLDINEFTLLERGLRNNSDTAIINLVLSLVVNETSEKNWEIADLIIQRLEYCQISADWWIYHALKYNDIEAQLVVGWLSKYGKIQDIVGCNYRERFMKVIKSGMILPKWLLK